MARKTKSQLTTTDRLRLDELSKAAREKLSKADRAKALDRLFIEGLNALGRGDRRKSQACGHLYDALATKKPTKKRKG